MATQSPTPTTLIARVTTIDGLSNEKSPYYPSESEEEDQDLSDGQTSDAKAFNYYFLMLAILVALVALLLWLIHRRRKRQRNLLRQSGQQALARDLEGWRNTQRLMHGRYRADGAVLVHRDEGLDEGLDERGEAPPPYQPKTGGTAADVTIPLRILARHEVERSHPPHYDESPQTHSSPDVRQETRYT